MLDANDNETCLHRAPAVQLAGTWHPRRRHV